MPAGVGRPLRGSNKEQTAAADRSGMEEEMAGLSLSDFEFFKILLPGMYEEALRLPALFARELGACRDLKLRLAGAGMPLWDVEVFADEKRGDMYLAQGWKKFARAHDLRDGYLLVFRYDDSAAAGATLTLTVFDRTTCRKPYVHAGAGKASRGARPQLAIAEPSQFAVSLRQCNLAAKQNQYLNVPVDFQDAHGYAGGAADGGQDVVGEPEAREEGARGPDGAQVRVAPVLRRQRARGRGHLLLQGDTGGALRRRRRRGVGGRVGGRRARAPGRGAQEGRHHAHLIHLRPRIASRRLPMLAAAGDEQFNQSSSATSSNLAHVLFFFERTAHVLWHPC